MIAYSEEHQVNAAPLSIRMTEHDMHLTFTNYNVCKSTLKCFEGSARKQCLATERLLD